MQHSSARSRLVPGRKTTQGSRVIAKVEELSRPASRQNIRFFSRLSQMHNSTLRSDLLMLLTALIWGSAFVAQRLGMDSIGPFLFTGLRFAMGALALLPVILYQARRQLTMPSSRPGMPLGGLLMGLALTLGINLQQVGLMFTSIAHSGFITGLYVIVVPLLGLFLGRRSSHGIWIGTLLALTGMYLLSAGEGWRIAPGDGLQLAGAFVWGVHVLLVEHFARHHDPLRLAFLQFMVCALISLALALLLEPITTSGILAAGPALLYSGLVSVGIGYTLQVVAQKHAIASHAAIIFSLEAVFAALAGAIFLGESLPLKGYIGCAVMFSGMLVAQLWPNPVKKSPRQAGC